MEKVFKFVDNNYVNIVAVMTATMYFISNQGAVKILCFALTAITCIVHHKEVSYGNR